MDQQKTLEAITKIISEFENQCEENEYTDTQDVWDLLKHIESMAYAAATPDGTRS